MPQFAGLKLTPDGDACVRFPALRKVKRIVDRHELLLDEPGVIGSAENGGFQALNLALQFGARGIALVGFDMVPRRDGAAHWHGQHRTLRNPKQKTMTRWRDHLDAQAKWFTRNGIKVVNVSTVSALQNYPRMTLAAALENFDVVS